MTERDAVRTPPTTAALQIEHDAWDLSEPDVLREASTLRDHLIEWRCGNDVGFGIMAYGAGAGDYTYTEVQHLPTFWPPQGEGSMEPRLVRFEGFERIHLVADVWGDDTNWPVLLMHGGGQTRHAWGNTAQTLASHGWRAVSLDLRGHGDSEWALNGDYSFTAYGADCVAVVDQLGRPPVLVGASLGGITAMLAEGGSDRVVSSGLVIVDVTHRTNPAGVQRIRDFMSSGVRGFATLDEAADAIAAYTPHRPRRVNPAGLMKVLRQKRDGRWYWHWDPKFLDHGRTEVPRREFEALFEAAMRNIAVPTLLVRGKLSDVVTEEGVQEFLRQIPGAKMVDVGGAAHMVAGDQNDAFSQAVVEFLERDIRPSLERER